MTDSENLPAPSASPSGPTKDTTSGRELDLSVFEGHTPGEWSVPHFAEPETKCRCGYVFGGDYQGSIATVNAKTREKNNDDPPIAEAIANARLIAAAPDLLAAVRRLQSENDALRGQCEIKGPPTRCSFCGYLKSETRQLLGGPLNVAVCSECVELSVEILIDDKTPRTAGFADRIRALLPNAVGVSPSSAPPESTTPELLTKKSTNLEVAEWLDGVADACEGEPNNDAWNLREAMRRIQFLPAAVPLDQKKGEPR